MQCAMFNDVIFKACSSDFYGSAQPTGRDLFSGSLYESHFKTHNTLNNTE